MNVLCTWKKDAVERRHERHWGRGDNGESKLGQEWKMEISVEIKASILSGEEEI